MTTLAIEIDANAAVRSSSRTFRRRLIALVVGLATAGVLAVAAWLEPASHGVGTHEQLGLPACGWVIVAGMPCPTCGMTTSFAHAADGHFLRAFLTQPMGCLLAIATAMALIVALHVLVTGSALGLVFARLWTRRSGWALAGLVVLSWTYKILHHKGVL